MPMMLSPKNHLIEKFIKEKLKRSLSQYRSYWKRRLFSGGGTPAKILQTQDEVLVYVNRNPNVIAVVIRTEESSKLSIKLID